MIRLHEVSKSFDGGKTHVVERLSLAVATGELLVLLGESGCGKTTTLKMINRLVEPTSGTIEVEGKDVRSVDPVSLRRRIGYVFQGVGLFPHMTVADNVAVVPRLLGWTAADVRKRVDELLELCGLEPALYRERLPRELSGGQRQRVGIARALAARPRLMLMDEPLGAIDPLTRAALQKELRQIHRELELTIVLVTHDMTEALLMADRIAVMSGGRILQIGAPRDLLRSPADDYVKALLAKPKEQADVIEALVEDRP